MPTGPTTKQTMLDVQSLMVSQYRVNGVLPFSALNATDAAKYGVENAVLLGPPKRLSSDYPKQCHICLPQNESVYRRAFSSPMGGGKVWDEKMIYVIFLFSNKTNSYQTYLDLLDAADEMHLLMQRYTMIPGSNQVAAAKEALHSSGSPTGFFHDDRIGIDWDCWGFLWWTKAEWSVPGGYL